MRFRCPGCGANRLKDYFLQEVVFELVGCPVLRNLGGGGQ